MGLMGIERPEKLGCSGRLMPVIRVEAAAANRSFVGVAPRAGVSTRLPWRHGTEVRIALRPGAAPRATGRVGRVEVMGRWLTSATRAPRTLGRGFVLIFQRRLSVPGAGSGGTRGRTTATRRGFQRRAARVHPRRVGGGSLVGPLVVVARVEAQNRVQFPRDAAEEGPLQGLRIGGGRGGRVIRGVRRYVRQVRHTEIPPDQSDQQHAAGGAQHHREALDEWIAAVDQEVFDTADLASVEQPVGARYSAEKYQR